MKNIHANDLVTLDGDDLWRVVNEVAGGKLDIIRVKRTFNNCWTYSRTVSRTQVSLVKSFGRTNSSF